MKTYKRNLMIILMLTASIVSISTKQLFAKQVLDPNLILEKSEFIRNPIDDYGCDVTIIDEKDGKKEAPKEFKALIKGRDKALVTYLKPIADKGTKVLMVGRDMWVQPTTSKKAIRVAANQKLTGNAAYGDVTRLSFVGNYKPTLKSDLSDRKDDPKYILELESLPDRLVTYDRIEYHINAKNYHPILIVYKTISNKILREATFESYESVLGEMRPVVMKLVNKISKDHITTMRFSNTKKETLSDSIFEKNNLGRR